MNLFQRLDYSESTQLFDLRTFKTSLLERNSDGDPRRSLLSESIVYIKVSGFCHPFDRQTKRKKGEIMMNAEMI